MSYLHDSVEAPGRLRRMAGRAVLVSLLALIGAPALASDTDLDRARAAKERAERAIVARDWCDAAHELERVYRYSGKAEALYNVGLAAERAGDRLFAARAFERFSALSPLSPQRPEALAHARRIRTAIGRQGPGRSCPPPPPEPAVEPRGEALPASPPIDDDAEADAASGGADAKDGAATVADAKDGDATGAGAADGAAAQASAPRASAAERRGAERPPQSGSAPTTVSVARPTAGPAAPSAGSARATPSPTTGAAPASAVPASSTAGSAPANVATAPVAAVPGSSARAAPAAALDPRPVPAEPAPGRGHGLRTAGWALIGTGLAGLGTGGAFTWSAGRTAATLEAEANADPLRPFDPELQGLERDYHFQRDLGAAGLLSGGALVITGAVLVLVDGASR